LKKRSKKQLKEYYKKKYVLGKKEIIAKTLVLRVISSILTAAIVFFMTGSINLSATILWVDFIIKTVVYYAYEVVWLKSRGSFLKIFS